ncbi:bifunctional 4-hydroxy-2-oxoglutarate aldolase/2-dehydro-3-deoxy-phosphogluconate aldolase, partial [Cognatilysobacter lacus]
MIWTPETRAARVDSILSQAPVLPVLAIDDCEDAVPLGRALVDAGLPVLEVTLRTPCALDAMRAIVNEVPGAVVGAGTMLRKEDFLAVEDTGAVFGIAPGSTAALYGAAELTALAFIPAIATASELMLGMEHGYRRFKFFPAEGAGGVSTLKAFSGPFGDVRFCPTGGIDAGKAPGYLALKNVATVGGSWMVPADRLAARDWAAIAAL